MKQCRKQKCIQSSHSEDIFRLTVSTSGVDVVAACFRGSLVLRPRDLVADPVSLALPPSTDTLAAAVLIALACCRRLNVTEVSTPLRLPLPVNFTGGSADTDDAREVEPDFFPPEQ